MKTNILFIFCLIFLFGCSRQYKVLEYRSSINNKKSISELDLKKWEYLDLLNDSVPGISLYRTNNELIKSKKGNDLIIAVLDTQLDINHEAIKPFLWTNKKEIPKNGIDDDKNGYVDDIHGWNFLSNSNGESILNSNFESRRIINHFKIYPLRNAKDSLLLSKAKESEKGIDNQFTQEKERIDYYKSVYPQCFKTIKTIFPKSDFTTKQLDSILKIHELDKNRQFYNELYLINELKKYNLDSTWLSNDIKEFEYNCKTIYNKDYYEKEITKDNPEDIKDSIYGSPNLDKFAKKSWHSTQVTGLIGNCLKIDPKTKIKIMPIVTVAPIGEENNKDVAIAIRYAVNNGAKVINMSFGNDISLDNIWVKQALLYAEKNDVLLVAGAGNGGTDIDKGIFYPIDYDEDTGDEFCTNLIKVGGISNTIDHNFLYPRTNYGKKNVDIFAPATNLYVPDATEGYKFNKGTSLATALTTAVAGIIRSYYPKLSASEVKQIILESGVSYGTLKVQMPGEKEGTLKPFKDLSKSGKVVNAYNAMLFAKNWHKKKRN